jgi:hypothetical protein
VANKRTYTDDELYEAIRLSTCWSEVMAALGKSPGSGTSAVKAVAERLGLDTSHFSYRRNFKPVPAVEIPFVNAIQRGGQSGLSIAARWFLDRGYVVSVPLEPASYDLVTESDSGLKRVQVKMTWASKDSGRYVADISRRVHDASAPRNANGNRRRVSYNAELIDYFFVITPNSSFLIPVDVIDGRHSIVLDEKYAAFAV